MMFDTPLRLPGIFRTPIGSRIVRPSVPRFARTINFMGDSITDDTNFNPSTTLRQNPLSAYVNWAMAALAGRAFPMWNPTGVSSGFTAQGVYEFATFGNTAGQINTNHVPQVNASPGDLVCILAGANNLGNVNQSAATAFAEIQSLVTSLRNGGNNNLLICALTPRASSNNTVGSDGNTFAVRVQQLNALLADWCPGQGILFCDWTPVIADSNGFWNAGFSSDNIHPNPIGAQAMGAFLASFLLANYRLLDPYINADFLATLNSQSVTTSGWSLQPYSSSTATQATVAGTDGLGDWRRVTVGNVTPANTIADFFRLNMALPVGWNVQNGDLIQPVVEMRINDQITNGRIMVRMTANSRTSRPIQMNDNDRTTFQPFQGWFFGQPSVVNAASTVEMLATLQGAPMSVDFRRIGFRKVNSMVPPFV
jgi:lysophospholipase L1-like esterase